MAAISVRVDGKVAVLPCTISSTELGLRLGDDSLWLHGNSGAFRAFAEAILMAVPPRAIIGERAFSVVTANDGTAVVLDPEAGR